MTARSGIAHHALTVLVGQLAVMAFGVTDTIVTGRYSQDSLAALSIGSAVFVSVYVAVMGLFQALLPIWAELHGARRPRAIGASVRQTLYLWLAASAFGMAILLHPGAILRATEVPGALQAEVRSYLAILAFALPPALLFRIYSTLSQAVDRPQFVTWLQLASLLPKLPLSLWFTFGGAGIAPQGAPGCAWATLVVNYLLLGVALAMLARHPSFRRLALWRRPQPPDWAELRQFLRLGLPAALSITVEVTSFTLMALFIARQGALAAAAHQIAANLAAVLYMVPLSLAIAVSAHVSFCRGAGEEGQAAKLALQGFMASALMGCALAAILFASRAPLTALYTTSADVAALAAALLAWVALYHVADSMQTLCIFVLRSYRITLAPLLIYGVLLWGLGLGGGYAIAYRGWQGHGPWPSPLPFWGASTAALTLTALVLLWLLTRALRWHTRPAATAREAAGA
ncbi:MATE family efflux transporter [Comamonas sp. NLF-1-9]|uniref:MATE family efflux transporter n=1 Tax=Comamonas sp. NLF-1-9 TaxID=2853163 RepID=UPI001C43F372|nr:MATE family efflux transporter [Comamonas sp. NLF-1-9]QXL83249.1 MATE family efflux transporter [Comamonas sp. NLF-1-9]